MSTVRGTQTLECAGEAAAVSFRDLSQGLAATSTTHTEDYKVPPLALSSKGLCLCFPLTIQ
jgi:hypothetical protein